MKRENSSRGFTLIEMLVVIAIIALLAGMIVPLASLVTAKKIKARARIEVDNLALAIDTYQKKKGFYPPDNTNNIYQNQLFYELWGMILQNPNSPPNNPNPLYTNTFNANEVIDAKTLTQFFGNGQPPYIGILNSSPDTNEIRNFIPTISAAEVQNINLGGSYPVWVFATPALGPPNAALPKAKGQTVNVIRYVSTNPTNNPSTYDLWVDVLIAGKTNRISNWSRDPQIVNN